MNTTRNDQNLAVRQWAERVWDLLGDEGMGIITFHTLVGDDERTYHYEIFVDKLKKLVLLSRCDEGGIEELASSRQGVDALVRLTTRVIDCYYDGGPLPDEILVHGEGYKPIRTSLKMILEGLNQ
jgi:hypothetical protein